MLRDLIDQHWCPRCFNVEWQRQWPEVCPRCGFRQAPAVRRFTVLAIRRPGGPTYLLQWHRVEAQTASHQASAGEVKRHLADHLEDDLLDFLWKGSFKPCHLPPVWLLGYEAAEASRTPARRLAA